MPSLKNNALIFLEIFLIECCAALLKPPVTSSLNSQKLKEYGESGVSREISNFFIFCPGKLYSKVFSKITFKVSTAFHFVQNRAKFENKASRPPSSSGICAK